MPLSSCHGWEVDPVTNPRIARGIGRRHLVEADRGSIRKDDSGPDQQRPTLSIGRPVVSADEAGTLWNEDRFGRLRCRARLQ